MTIALEARAFVEQLGQREDLDLMIDRAKHVVPGLASIEAALDEVTDDMPPGLTLWTHRGDIGG